VKEPYRSRRLLHDERLLPDVRESLQTGEVVRCAVKVAKIHPALDLLVVTDRRVLAGWRAELSTDEFRWKVELALEDVDHTDISGFMDNVAFFTEAGKRTKVGNLLDGRDIGKLRDALSRKKAKADPGTGEAYWELYEPER